MNEKLVSFGSGSSDFHERPFAVIWSRRRPRNCRYRNPSRSERRLIRPVQYLPATTLISSQWNGWITLPTATYKCIATITASPLEARSLCSGVVIPGSFLRLRDQRTVTFYPESGRGIAEQLPT